KHHTTKWEDSCSCLSLIQDSAGAKRTPSIPPTHHSPLITHHSQNSVLFKHFPRAASLGQFRSDAVLAADLLQGTGECLIRELGRNHHNAVDVAKNPVTRPNNTIADLNRLSEANTVEPS